MNDVAAQRAAWRRVGPPIPIALIHIARAVGVDLVPDGEDEAPEGVVVEGQAEINIPAGRMTLAEIASDIPLPVAGGETLAASAAIFEKLMKAAQP